MLKLRKCRTGTCVHVQCTSPKFLSMQRQLGIFRLLPWHSIQNPKCSIHLYTQPPLSSHPPFRHLAHSSCFPFISFTPLHLSSYSHSHLVHRIRKPNKHFLCAFIPIKQMESHCDRVICICHWLAFGFLYTRTPIKAFAVIHIRRELYLIENSLNCLAKIDHTVQFCSTHCIWCIPGYSRGYSYPKSMAFGNFPSLSFADVRPHSSACTHTHISAHIISQIFS